MRFALCTMLVLASTTMVFGCKKDTPPPPPDAGQPDEAAAPEEDDEIRPVYPEEVGEIPAAVRSLCTALHTRPKERRGECCEQKPGILLTDECERNLAGALLVKGLTLDESKIAACVAAIEKQHEGCDWVAPSPLRTPKACFGLVKGLIKPGQKCRSTLECPDTMLCHGLGPTDLGRCGPSAPPGIVCNTGVDPLVAYLRQDNVDKERPACVGYCDRNRCRPFHETGAACISNLQCGPEQRCKEGKCQDGARAALGEPCIGGDCVEGLRCAQKKCVAPRKVGEMCTVSAECLSVCEAGKCKTSCDAAPMLKTLSPPPTKPGDVKKRKKKPAPKKK